MHMPRGALALPVCAQRRNREREEKGKKRKQSPRSEVQGAGGGRSCVPLAVRGLTLRRSRGPESAASVPPPPRPALLRSQGGFARAVRRLTRDSRLWEGCGFSGFAAWRDSYAAAALSLGGARPDLGPAAAPSTCPGMGARCAAGKACGAACCVAGSAPALPGEAKGGGSCLLAGEGGSRADRRGGSVLHLEGRGSPGPLGDV